jgi:hypothetical protein
MGVETDETFVFGRIDFGRVKGVEFLAQDVDKMRAFIQEYDTALADLHSTMATASTQEPDPNAQDHE